MTYLEEFTGNHRARDSHLVRPLMRKHAPEQQYYLNLMQMFLFVHWAELIEEENTEFLPLSYTF